MANEFVRRLLDDWARWLCSGGGYAHKSSVECVRDGGIGTGVFQSSIPRDVEPSLSVIRTSRAMQHLRLIDGEAAHLLTQIYLRRNKSRLFDLATESGVSLTSYQGKRRIAETQLLSLWEALGDDSIR